MKTSATSSSLEDKKWTWLETEAHYEWIEGFDIDEYLRTAFPPDDFPTFHSTGELLENELLRFFSILFRLYDSMKEMITVEPQKEITISDLIIEFHRLYADYKKPEYLEIAGILGTIKAP